MNPSSPGEEAQHRVRVEDLVELSRLFDELQPLPPAAREPRLSALAQGQAPLGRRLRRMLDDHDAGRTSELLPPLVTPAVSGEAEAGEDAQAGAAAPGERIGPYRLLHEIGRGGMGSVWLAERADGAFERRVALKLPRLAGSPGLARRLQRECGIAARLEHPHIARLYDAGVDAAGRPYIAMQYVDGVPIDAWCRHQALDLPARLRLFLQVLGAVAHAHQHQVVHRDLKPANVLVDGAGQVQLLDFGIAALLSTPAPGADGAPAPIDAVHALTPRYAAPEQFAVGPPEVRSDVYSLGVLLYELLTGTLPGPALRMGLTPADATATDRPQAPLASQRVGEHGLRRALQGDLDAVLARALQPRPEARYPSVQALADELERWLRGEAVSARPDTRWRALRRHLRRHRGPAVAAGLVVLALAVGAAGIGWQRHQAQAALAQQRQLKDFVAEVFLAGGAGQAPERALAGTADRVRQRFAGQPALQAELYGLIGQVFAEMGAPGPAAAHARLQLAALQEAGEQGGRARALQLLARATFDDGRLADAEPLATQALAAADNPGARADAAVLLARVQTALGRLAEGEATLAALPAPAGDVSMPRAWQLYLKAFHERRQGRFDVAMPGFRAALALAEQAGGPQHPDLQWMRLDYGYELIVRHRRDEALPLVQAALAGLQARGDASRVNAALRRAGLWATMGMMGQLPPAEALHEIETARLAAERVPIAVPPEVTARFEFQRARMLGQQGRITEALALMDRSVPLLVAATEFAGGRFTLVSSHARVALHAGEHVRAHALLLERMRLREAMGQTRIPFAANDHAMLALNHLMRGDLDAAQAVLDRAPVFEPDRGDPSAGRIYAELIPWERARLLLHRGRVDQALAAIAPLGVLDDGHDLQSQAALRAEIGCAARAVWQGQALAALQRQIGLRGAQVDADDPTLAHHRAVAGLCLLQAGQRAEAASLARQAAASFERQPGVSAWFRAPLIRLQQQLGR